MKKDAPAEYLLDQDCSNPLCTDKSTFRKTLCCILLWIYTHVKLDGEFVVHGLDTKLILHTTDPATGSDAREQVLHSPRK